jgi:hypothetical protein
MSDVMLQAVLRMPPSCWDEGCIDQAQRHARYIEAADRIEQLEAALELCLLSDVLPEAVRAQIRAELRR